MTTTTTTTSRARRWHAVLWGVLGLVVMFGLTRRSDRAAEAAGAVAVPERTRTLALACAIVVPFTAAMLADSAAAALATAPAALASEGRRLANDGVDQGVSLMLADRARTVPHYRYPMHLVWGNAGPRT